MTKSEGKLLSLDKLDYALVSHELIADEWVVFKTTVLPCDKSDTQPSQD